MGFTETWLEEKDVIKSSHKLPSAFNWKIVYAERKFRKSRAMGGIITGLKKNIIEIKGNYVESETLQEIRIKIDNEI